MTARAVARGDAPVDARTVCDVNQVTGDVALLDDVHALFMAPANGVGSPYSDPFATANLVDRGIADLPAGTRWLRTASTTMPASRK